MCLVQNDFQNFNSLFGTIVKVVWFQTNCGKQNTVDGSLKQIVGNKMQSQEVSNKQLETKHSRQKSQTVCGKQNTITVSLKQTVGNKK